MLRGGGHGDDDGEYHDDSQSAFLFIMACVSMCLFFPCMSDPPDHS